MTNYDPLLDAMGLVATANAERNGAAFVMASRTFYELAALKDVDTNPLVKPGPVEATPFIDSNNVLIDEGTGDDSSIFFGYWSQFLVGVWQSLRIRANPWQFGSLNQTSFEAVMSTDYNVRHIESFHELSGIAPPA